MLTINTQFTNRIATIDAVVADTLEISQADLSDDLGYQSICQWDSLRHVSLMLKLEQTFGIKIEPDLITELRDYRSIKEYFSKLVGNEVPNTLGYPMGHTATTETVHRGLSNVVLDETSISRIEGEKGILEYRGYAIHDLVQHASFESTAYLLIYGNLPNTNELAHFTARLEAVRHIPDSVLQLMREMKNSHPMDALRTGISALCQRTSVDEADLEEDGIHLLAQIPILIGTHYAARTGRTFSSPPSSLSFSEYFLTALLGNAPTASQTRLMDKDLILHADLGSNPASLAARVAISTRAGMYAAMTAAISVFNGSLHGGAAESVLSMINEVGHHDRAATYVKDCWARNIPVMGFGHRIFRVEDPRVRHFRAAAYELSVASGKMDDFKILEAIEHAMLPYGRYGVWPNVDLYAGVVYKLLGLAADLTVPIFVAGRALGWIAQALEQHRQNILIYPTMKYIGKRDLTFPHNSNAGMPQ